MRMPVPRLACVGFTIHKFLPASSVDGCDFSVALAAAGAEAAAAAAAVTAALAAGCTFSLVGASLCVIDMLWPVAAKFAMPVDSLPTEPTIALCERPLGPCLTGVVEGGGRLSPACRKEQRQGARGQERSTPHGLWWWLRREQAPG